MKSMRELVSGAMTDITNPETRIDKDCDCGKTFSVVDNAMAQYKKRCAQCYQEWEKSNEKSNDERLAERRVGRWTSLCPPDYAAVDRARLPNPSKLDEVMKWEYGPLGLVLHGETGTGKTRCGWALLKREVFHDRSIRVLDSMAGLRYAAMYSRDASEVEKWMRGLIETEILFADDVFKNKLTDSFEGVIFTLIDQRLAHRRPTILTSNDTGETLSGRLTQDRATPLLRRLRESCQQIHF